MTRSSASVQRQRQELFVSLAERARQAGFLLQGNFEGFFLVPLADGQPMNDEAFAALPAEERAELLQTAATPSWKS